MVCIELGVHTPKSAMNSVVARAMEATSDRKNMSLLLYTPFKPSDKQGILKAVHVPPSHMPFQETLRDQWFESTPLRETSFEKTLFERCHFHKTPFTGCDLSDSRFEHCEISLPHLLGCGLKNILFQNCKLVGVDFTRCSPRFFRVVFEDCLIDTCNFSGVELSSTPFLRCTIRETRFVESRLEKARFDGSDLERTLFHQCDLRQASFIGAKNYTIHPTINRLEGTHFSLPEAISLLTPLGIILH